MKKIIFLDRDGVIIGESPDEMLNEVHKFRFLPGAITHLSKIANELDYLFVLVSNQDGLGSVTYPEKEFWPLQELMLDTLKAENVHFDGVYIDRHFPQDHSSYRKPGTAMLKKYTDGPYDLENSYVIGDRMTDMELACNLGAKGILLRSIWSDHPGLQEPTDNTIVCRANNWNEVYRFLIEQDRKSRIDRTTSETQIEARINLDGSGVSQIETGLPFYDHMLTQISKHGSVDLFLHAKGDLEVDEHHTVEDVGIVLGQVVHEGLGKKAGIERYGFSLPMDDCHAWVSLDFGGRPELIWEVKFNREKIGDVPSEMFRHFFKSFSDHAKCNLYVKADGENEHHKIESIFKAFAKAIKMAVKRDFGSMKIPSTKGML